MRPVPNKIKKLKVVGSFFPALLLGTLCCAAAYAAPENDNAGVEKSATEGSSASTDQEITLASDVDATVNQFRDLVSRSKLLLLEVESLPKDSDRLPRQQEALDLLNKADILFLATAPSIREQQLLTEAGDWVAKQLEHLRALPQMVELGNECRTRGFLHYRNEEYDKALMAFDEYRIFVPDDKAVDYIIAKLYKNITGNGGN